MQHRTITLSDPDLGQIELTLCRADVRRDIQRARLESDAAKEPRPDRDEQLFATDVYPLLVAGTVAVVGLTWPLDVSALMALPAQVVLDWRNAIWDINPAWRPVPLVTPAEKKDAPAPSMPG